jgi:hypothetical protein
LNLTVGRRDANLVRSTLQKVLITGKPRTEVQFRRRIEFSDGEVVIFDTIDARGAKVRFKRLAVGSDATSIYVANSNTYQESVLCPWVDLSSHVETLNREGVVELPPRKVRPAGRA